MSDHFELAIKIIASFSALYMCVSPWNTVYKIHKQRCIGQTSIIPLVALWVCDHMWMLYGYVTDDTFPLLVTYAAGSAFNIGFVVVYLRYSTRRAQVLKFIAIALVCNIAVTIYAVLAKLHVFHHPADIRNQAVGFVAVASSLLLYASPFFTLSHVVKSKSSSSIPITMCVVGVVNNALWVIYGTLISDLMLVVPPSVNIVVGSVQIAFYFVYRPRSGWSIPVGHATVGDPVLPTTIPSPISGKHDFQFSSMATPRGGRSEAESGAATAAASVHVEMELSKITLETPSLEQTWPPLPSSAATPES